MSVGPTRGASEERAWSASPVRAWLVRVVVFLAPIAMAFTVTRIASLGFRHPAGWTGLVVYIAQGAVVGAAAALLTGRGIRSLLPLASLLNMTLVFPDRAPSRFGVALRSGTINQLKRQLASGEIDWPPDEQDAAEVLVAIVTELGRHDRLTRGHTERVRAIADLIGEELGLSDEDRELLHWGAMAHDIGKLTVAPEILNKNGRPTDAEWATLTGHPEAGGRMLEPLAGWLGQWRFAASQHHERWDGTGYPAGLAGTDISLAGRIVAVADAYDVITSNRSYKKAMSPTVARDEMVRCAGTQFDPTVVRALLNVSLTKDRPAVGLVGWLAELRGLAALSNTVSQVAGTVAATAAVTAGISLQLVDPPAQRIAAAETASETPASLLATDDGTTLLTTLATPQSTTARTSTETASPADTVQAEPTEATGTTTDPTNSSTTPTTGSPSDPAPGWSPPTTTTPPTTTVEPTTTSTTAAGPTAFDDTGTQRQGQQNQYPVLDNDTAGSSPLDTATLAITTPPAHGTAQVWQSTKIRYTADPGYTGPVTVTYQICDTTGLCGQATLTIELTP